MFYGYSHTDAADNTHFRCYSEDVNYLVMFFNGNVFAQVLDCKGQTQRGQIQAVDNNGKVFVRDYV